MHCSLCLSANDYRPRGSICIALSAPILASLFIVSFARVLRYLGTIGIGGVWSGCLVFYLSHYNFFKVVPLAIDTKQIIWLGPGRAPAENGFSVI